MFDAFILSNGYTVSSIQGLGKSSESHVGNSFYDFPLNSVISCFSSAEPSCFHLTR